MTGFGQWKPSGQSAGLSQGSALGWVVSGVCSSELVSFLISDWFVEMSYRGGRDLGNTSDESSLGLVRFHLLLTPESILNILWLSCVPGRRVIFHSSKWPFERHGSALKALKWLSIMRGYDHGLKCHAQVPQDTKGFQWGAQADTAWRHKWSSLCPAEPAPFIWREIDFMAIILISRKLWGAGKWSMDLTLNCQYQAWRARLSLGKAGRGRAKLKRR